MILSAFLFDLDGVVRFWDDTVTPVLERDGDLEAGAIESAAFEPRALESLTTGRMTKADWLARVAAELGAEDAVRRWSLRRTWFDPSIMQLVERVREDRLVALVTNGTDELDAELDVLGIGGKFDYVWNSADIGFAKPALGFYRHVLAVLGVAPESVGYVDDRDENVQAALSLDMKACVYSGCPALEQWMRDQEVL